MKNELFIPECFSLDPDAAALIREIWAAPEYSDILRFISENIFETDSPAEKSAIPCPADKLDQLMFAAAAAAYPNAVKRYEKLNWPIELLNDTLLDMQVWSRHHFRNHGTWGLCRDGALFIRQQLRATVIRFGRLQCNTSYPLWRDLADPNGKWFLPKGTQVINMHIPATGPMPVSECLDSMEKMKEFFRIYQPQIDWKAFICHSWLLDTQLQKLLPETSNIIQFQKLGTLIEEPEKSTDTIFRVFGVKAVTEGVTSVPWETSMQKILGKFVLDGGTFHPGIMVIPR